MKKAVNAVTFISLALAASVTYNIVQHQRAKGIRPGDVSALPETAGIGGAEAPATDPGANTAPATATNAAPPATPTTPNPAAADTPIYSCTAGTVKAIGFNDIAGYYVVIEDGYGYEYHYYHMIRLSGMITVGERVEQGMQIGNVGCTGNSDANHLHLSIITPEHVHLNPYFVMLEIRNRH